MNSLQQPLIAGQPGQRQEYIIQGQPQYLVQGQPQYLVQGQPQYGGQPQYAYQGQPQTQYAFQEPQAYAPPQSRPPQVQPQYPPTQAQEYRPQPYGQQAPTGGLAPPGQEVCETREGSLKQTYTMLDATRRHASKQLRDRAWNKFQDDKNTAMRVAFWCLVFGLPIFYPSIGQFFPEKFLINITAGITMLIFTASSNLGTTIMLAWHGMSGTFSATLMSHLMHFVQPGGAHGAQVNGTHFNAPLCHGLHILFIIVGLSLAIEDNTKKFMLSSHCYFMMEFFNPSSTVNFSLPGTPGYFHSIPFLTLAASGCGCLFAIVAMAFPARISARTHCRKAAMRSTKIITNLVDDIVEYYQGNEQSCWIRRCEAVKCDLDTVLQTMDADLNAGWWELFGSKKNAQIREVLKEHKAMTERMKDIIDCLFVCVSKEDFHESHSQFMPRINHQVNGLVLAVRDLLRKVTKYANDGSMDKEEREAAKDCIDKVESCQRELAIIFNRVRKDLCPGNICRKSMQAENYFLYCLDVYAHEATKFSKGLLGELKDFTKSEGFLTEVSKSVAGMFDQKTFTSKSHRSFVQRNTVSILLCFYIGYYLDYASAISTTASVLLSRYIGSALQRNLGRLQGVVVGNIVPHIWIQMTDQWCNPPDGLKAGNMVTLLTMLAFFMWETGTLYTSYASKDFGFIAILSAGFAPPIFAISCPDPPGGMDFKQIAVLSISRTAIACVVLGVVDTILAPESSSHLASRKLKDGCHEIDEAFREAIAGNQPWPHAPILEQRHKGILKQAVQKYKDDKNQFKEQAAFYDKHIVAIKNNLGKSFDISKEANKEPRLWKCPWPQGFYLQIHKSCKILMAYSEELESVSCGSDDVKDDLLTYLESSRHWLEIKEHFRNQYHQAQILVSEIMGNEEATPMEELLKELQDVIQDDQETIAKLADDMKNRLSYPDDSQVQRLEDDIILRINCIIVLMDAAQDEVGEIIKACFKNA